jgi:hypothetical protein
MRRKNQCVMCHEPGGTFAFCTGWEGDCIHNTADMGGCPHRTTGSECRSKFARKDAATKRVKTLRRKYGVTE